MKSPKTNTCSDPDGHGFKIIQDRNEIKRIRLQYPKLGLSLWRCSKCGKIKESM